MYLNVGTDRRLYVIASNITQNMKVPVHFIDITSLSEYRKDAHTSVYTIRQGKMLTPEQQADPATYADCEFRQVGRSIFLSKFRPLGILEEDEEFKLPPKDCDLFTGNWVFDNIAHPLYKEAECNFLSEQVTCIRNGRRDYLYRIGDGNQGIVLCRSKYQFKARLLLEKLRGKRLMFVGDSLNRNQWESMVCLLQSAISPGKKSLKESGSLVIFSIEEYNTTVEFYWAPFLVESNSDNPWRHSIKDRVIMPDSIKNKGGDWEGVDFLIFNTYLVDEHWIHESSPLPDDCETGVWIGTIRMELGVLRRLFQ
ncbi:hypothetical protein CRYUN_Cryun41cG0005200 [Craigia yunnanensis]